jgi:hypothetical protein
MDEYQFLRNMYYRLQEAERLDKILTKANPKIVDRAVSSIVACAIRDYLELRKEN